MDEQLAEKFATKLAARAAEVKTAGVNSALSNLIKQAARKQSADATAFKDVVTNPLFYGPLLGTSVGGLAGYFGTRDDDKKKKKRNAMYGALTGGLGGLGIPLFLSASGAASSQLPASGSEEQKQQQQQQQTADENAQVAGLGHTSNSAVNSVYRTGSRLGAGGVGWGLGGPVGRFIDRWLPTQVTRGGELKRFMRPTPAGKPSAVGKRLGYETPQTEVDRVKQYGKGITDLQKKLDAGQTAARILPKPTAKTKPEDFASFAKDWAGRTGRRVTFNPSGKPVFANPADAAAAHADFTAKLPGIQRANVAARKAIAAHDAEVRQADRLLAGVRSRLPFRGTLGWRASTRARNAELMHKLVGGAGTPGVLTHVNGQPPTLARRGLNYGTRGLLAYLLGREATPERADALQNFIHSRFYPAPAETPTEPSANEPAVK